jgi:hypothetical protein
LASSSWLADLVHCRHRHTNVHIAQNLGLHFAVEAVRKPVEPLDAGWSRNPPDRRPSAVWRSRQGWQRAHAGPPPSCGSRRESWLQPARRLAGSNEHVVARFTAMSRFGNHYARRAPSRASAEAAGEPLHQPAGFLSLQQA